MSTVPPRVAAYTKSRPCARPDNEKLQILIAKLGTSTTPCFFSAAVSTLCSDLDRSPASALRRSSETASISFNSRRMNCRDPHSALACVLLEMSTRHNSVVRTPAPDITNDVTTMLRRSRGKSTQIPLFLDRSRRSGLWLPRLFGPEYIYY